MTELLLLVNSWLCTRFYVLYYLPPCRRVIINLLSAELFTACVNLHMDVCSAVYFIWSSSKINTVRTTANGGDATDLRVLTVNRNERSTGYSSVLTCLTAGFRDSTGLLYTLWNKNPSS